MRQISDAEYDSQYKCLHVHVAAGETRIEIFWRTPFRGMRLISETSAGYTCDASVHDATTIRMILKALRISTISYKVIRQNKSLCQNIYRNTRKLGGIETEIRRVLNDYASALPKE